jgi:hypothetical protein
MLQRSRQYTPLCDRVRTGIGDAPEGFTAAVVWPLETVSDCVPCVEAGAPRQHRPNESNARQSFGEVLRFGARRRGGPLAR